MTPNKSPRVAACELLEEVANSFSQLEGGEGGGSNVVTEGEDELGSLANQIHLLMDSAPIQPTGETSCVCSGLLI